MNWQSITFDWNHVRAFLVTAEEGSLSAAARALDLTQPTLSRQVASLEESLGLTLFERVGRGFELTETGEELLKHARLLGEAASQFSLAVSSRQDSLEGSVSISATESTAVFMLPPIIEKLQQTYPGITLDLIATNENSDLKRREADIAIRFSRPTDLDLIAKKIRSFHYQLFAAKSYIAAHGPFNKLSDFGRANFIGFDKSNEFLDMLNEHGLNLTQANFPLRAENHAAHWALVKQGLGIGGMQREIGLADPSVALVLPNVMFPADDVWLVVHSELNTNKRIRCVFDFLAAELA